MSGFRWQFKKLSDSLYITSDFKSVRMLTSGNAMKSRDNCLTANHEKKMLKILFIEFCPAKFMNSR